MVEIAQWDTEHLGIKVGNLILNDGQISKEYLEAEMLSAKSKDFDLLYLKGVSLPDCYLSKRIVLADEKVIYSQIVYGKSYVPSDKVVSYLTRELDVKLLSLALQSGGHSRYYTDKNIPIHVFLTLYQTWIKNSLNGSIATDVLVYKEGNDVLGLLTYKLELNCAVIGLVDVDSTSKGKGVGSKLMQTFLSKLPDGMRVEVATQRNNVGACRYYEKNGFNVERITNIYHLWPKL